jgi:hypothetical protein
MDSNFRAIRTATVMCTVQGCGHTAAFLFTGGNDRSGAGRPTVAAFCREHAEQTAARIGQPGPAQEALRERRPVRKGAVRTG